jgi:hypothetical protein
MNILFVIRKLKMANNNVNDVLLYKTPECSHNKDAKCLLDKSLDIIIEALRTNESMNVDYLGKYLFNLVNVKTHYYYSHRDRLCLIHNSNKIKEMFNLVFEMMPTIFDKMYKTDPNLLSRIILYPEYDSCYKYLNVNKDLNYKVPDEYLQLFINRMSSCYSGNETNDELVQFIIKNVEPTVVNITKLCKCKHNLITNYVASIIDKSSEEFDDGIMTIACLNLPFSKSIIHSLLARGIKIQDNHVKTVLKYSPVESIEFIFNLVENLVITKGHYNELLTAEVQKNGKLDERNTKITKKVVQKLNDYYEIYITTYTSNYTAEKMQILINFGFVPDKNDILNSVKLKKEIPHIEKFDVKLDADFLKLCQDNNFYPKYNFVDMPKEMYELQELCLSKTLPKIRTFFTKNPTIIPDSLCMKNACCVSSNDKIIQLLIQHGGIIDRECIEKYMKLSADYQTKIIFNNFVLNNDITLKVKK